MQLANATQDLTQALGDQVTARRQLARRLSLAQSVSISAADPVEIAGLWNLALEESIVLAFQNRAELTQQLARRNISESQRRIALSQIRPRVSLVTTYNVLDAIDDDVSGLADGFSLGARFSLNLFDGGAARARANQEEANIAIAETTFADTRDQVRFEGRTSLCRPSIEFGEYSNSLCCFRTGERSLTFGTFTFPSRCRHSNGCH